MHAEPSTDESKEAVTERVLKATESMSSFACVSSLVGKEQRAVRPLWTNGAVPCWPVSWPVLKPQRVPGLGAWGSC